MSSIQQYEFHIRYIIILKRDFPYSRGYHMSNNVEYYMEAHKGIPLFL